MCSGEESLKLLGLSKEQVKQVLAKGSVTIAVYGLGRIGLPLAAVFSDKGAHVIGVDIKDEVVDSVNKGINPYPDEPGLAELVKRNVEEGRLQATTDGAEAAKKADVMIIIVPVVADKKGRIRFNALLDVAEKISKGLERGDIVITETTLPPGATESLVPILNKSGLRLGDYGLAHAPERTMVGRVIRDITGEYPKIIGASDAATLEAVSGLYESINKKGVIRVSSIRAAEAVKVFEGVYRDVNIALANQLALWAEEQGLDVYEIIETANTQPYSHIHRPGAGVGGHCIPVYPWFLISTAKRVDLSLVRIARQVNDSMPRHIVELVIKALNRIGRSAKGSNVLVLGIAYRGNVKDHSNSPGLEIARILRDEWQANVYIYDPYYSPQEVQQLGFTWKNDYKDIDVIVIATDHAVFKKLDLDNISREARNKIIVDGRNVVNPLRAREKGFIYISVGRAIQD